jgi:ABC-type multidrug transport system fused ATPase/permease subunit
MKRSSVENTNKFIALVPRSFLELFAIITISMIIFFFIYYDYDFKNIIPTLTLLAVLLVRSIPALGIINISFNFLQFQKHSLIFILKELESNQCNLEVSKRDKTNLIKDISIKDLSFSYPNSSNKLFDRLNLNIRNNQFIGIIGPSGSGKTSLIDLLLGLYQPSRGEIIVDNIKNKILHKDFRDNISYIPQDIYLVDDSIKKNIALGVEDADIDESKIYEILEILNLRQISQQISRKK